MAILLEEQTSYFSLASRTNLNGIESNEYNKLDYKLGWCFARVYFLNELFELKTIQRDF